MKNGPRYEELTKALRRVERADRVMNDPWFGRRRRAGAMGESKTKAAANKRACRGRKWVDG